MFQSRVTLDLKGYHPCHGIALVKFTWDARKRDEGKIYYCLGNKPKLKIFRVYFISNYNTNYNTGKIVLCDDVPKSVCRDLKDYRKISQKICHHTQTELKKLTDLLSLVKPPNHNDPSYWENYDCGVC